MCMLPWYSQMIRNGHPSYINLLTISYYVQWAETASLEEYNDNIANGLQHTAVCSHTADAEVPLLSDKVLDAKTQFRHCLCPLHWVEWWLFNVQKTEVFGCFWLFDIQSSVASDLHGARFFVSLYLLDVTLRSHWSKYDRPGTRRSSWYCLGFLAAQTLKDAGGQERSNSTYSRSFQFHPIPILYAIHEWMKGWTDELVRFTWALMWLRLSHIWYLSLDFAEHVSLVFDLWKAYVWLIQPQLIN